MQEKLRKKRLEVKCTTPGRCATPKQNEYCIELFTFEVSVSALLRTQSSVMFSGLDGTPQHVSAR